MGRPLVTLDRVDVRLGGAPVLAGISLQLRAGDGLAVLGGNGAGKSTLLRLLRGELWPDPHGPGRRLFHGPDGAFESPIGVRERLARVAPEAQDAYARNDWDLPVEAVIRSGFSDALWPSEAATAAQAARVRAAAEALGVEHLLGRSILELSRGEGRRVLLARALAPGPDALLLDEACDGLDPAARAAFLERVSAVARAGTAVVMATHRPEELVPELRHAIRLEHGRITWSGPRQALPGAPAAGTADAADRVGEAEGSAPQRGTAGSRRAGTSPAPEPGDVEGRASGRGRILFAVRRATVRVEGRAVLREVDWTVRAGERWAVTGPNGAGKSTLLRLLAGEEQPATGTVDRLGLGPRGGADALRGRIGVVSPELQARHRLDATGTAVVLSGFAGTIGLAVEPTATERAAASAAAARLGVLDLLERHVLSLSYGELRKLLLARALAPGPEVLLLDEPLAGLDAGSRAWVLRALDESWARGAAVVAVSHHADELPAGSDGVARIEGGRLVVVRG